MSEAKGQNNKRPKDKGANPTRSFDSSVAGPGSQIGQFRIERELGRGAVGVVYLAHAPTADVYGSEAYEDVLTRLAP